jgi:hypothetical protein
MLPGRAVLSDAQWLVEADPLYLIENRSLWQLCHKADRIVLGCSSNRLIVKRHVTVAARLADGAGQRRLAALARTVN